eukprot:7018227-Ditylum_brightwellii.AAC.1
MHQESKERSCKSKKEHFCSDKATLCGFLSNKSKDLNTNINKGIAKAFSHQEKKEKYNFNKYETLSISSGSNVGDSDRNSKVSSTSDEVLASK